MSNRNYYSTAQMSKQEGRENGKGNGAIVLHEALTLGKASALTS